MDGDIDTILIDNMGIYVFEMKMRNDDIRGYENEKYWVQYLGYEGSITHSLYNPIWQNKGHIDKIRRSLPKKYFDHIYSFVVFSNHSNLHIAYQQSLSNYVINLKELHLTMERQRKIKNLDSEFKELTNEDINYIYKQIKKCSNIKD